MAVCSGRSRMPGPSMNISQQRAVAMKGRTNGKQVKTPRVDRQALKESHMDSEGIVWREGSVEDPLTVHLNTTIEGVATALRQKAGT